MKTTGFLLTFLFIAVLQSGSTAQTARDGARSVVKVVTEYPATDHGKPALGKGSGTGWCYHDNLHIITALHVVAGIPDNKITIYTDENKKKCGARVEKVFREADLALLALSEDIGLP